MAQLKLGDVTVNTNGEIPEVGSLAPTFTLANTKLKRVTLKDFPGTKLLNIFPSVDTGTCSMSVRTFNRLAGSRDDVTVLNVSYDLPFAHRRFCGAEGIEGVESLSCWDSTFATDYGVKMVEGAMRGFCARVVLVLDGENRVIYRELVPVLGDEPDYESALAVLS